MLIAFAGLPGTGKTTLAMRLAVHLDATYLRVDEIEQALRGADLPVGPAGYLIGYALARSNLALGRPVVADSVNPLGVTRDAWRAAATGTGRILAEVEVVCSDRAEHRHRVETRVTDISGLRPPGWAAVTGREYEPWDRDRIVIDTAGTPAEESLRRLIAALPA